MNDKGVHCTAGDSHTAVLTEIGDVWLWGTFRDANGRLGMRSGNDAKEGEGEKAVLHEPTKLDLPTKVSANLFLGQSIIFRSCEWHLVQIIFYCLILLVKSILLDVLNLVNLDG